MRPYIICHMVESVDGRIDCDMVDKISGDEYYTALNSLECTSQVEGKYSYQLHHCGFEEFKPKNYAPIGKEVFFKAAEAKGYEISVDTKGTLLWDKTENNGRLCIVSEDASTEYLDYLRNLGISYIASGKGSIDLKRTVEILYNKFGVKRLGVLGGGKINGGFLSAGIVDELSLLIAPGIDGRCGQPALFDGIENKEGFIPLKLKFKEVSTFPNGVIWLRYLINH
ncbi:MAG: dihydrofolate reductase family protein [Muribaculaceae bacterium]|nr:dihydrofolate reductase family protein [Muribaculaceae bacterium]